MRTSTRKEAAVYLGFVLFCAASSKVGSEEQRGGVLKLNRNAFKYAQELIQEGDVVADKRNAWGEQQPSAEDENAFIREHGFAEYAKWHLGIDERHAEDSKARYKFPYGDFKNVHRSALLAARSRARQHSYSDIEAAAVELIAAIEKRGR